MMTAENIIPKADELRAATRHTVPEESRDIDLTPYLPVVGSLARQAAARGEKGMVIKFEVADYADEATCGRAISAMGTLLEKLGYVCCVSYDTYALKRNKTQATSSVMRNQAIIAMTVIW